jgi:agmatinase
MRFGLDSGQVKTYYAHELARSETAELELRKHLNCLSGLLYVTIDMDVLEVHLCPATGTPQPGGLSWWQALGYLHALLRDNKGIDLVGADVVETVPGEHSQVNQFVAARLICKVLTYWFSAHPESSDQEV